MAEETEDGGAPRRRSAPAGDGFSFTRKLGPLPVWAWMALSLAGAVIWSTWRKNKQGTTTTPTGATGAGAQQNTQTPPFIIQNYSGAGPQGPAGAPGQPGVPATPGQPVGGTVWQGGNPPVGASGVGSLVPPAVPSPVTVPTPVANQPRQAAEYRVKPGDTLTAIAHRYGTDPNTVWNYNIDPRTGRPPATIQTLRQRGPDNLVTNELILIPQ